MVGPPKHRNFSGTSEVPDPTFRFPLHMACQNGTPLGCPFGLPKPSQKGHPREKTFAQREMRALRRQVRTRSNESAAQPRTICMHCPGGCLFRFHSRMQCDSNESNIYQKHTHTETHTHTHTFVKSGESSEPSKDQNPTPRNSQPVKIAQLKIPLHNYSKLLQVETPTLLESGCLKIGCFSNVVFSRKR